MIKYFPPAEAFLAKFPALDLGNPARQGQQNEYDLVLQALMKRIISTVGIDERAYYETYPDIEDAVAGGNLPSGLYHFSTYGYFERRMAVPASFDEAWYLATYPDVGLAIADGEYPDAEGHYLETGLREWRAPCEGCSEDVGLWHQTLS